MFIRRLKEGNMYSLSPFNFKWWVHQTHHRVLLKEVNYLPALFIGWGGSGKTSCNDGLANKKVCKAYSIDIIIRFNSMGHRSDGSWNWCSHLGPIFFLPFPGITTNTKNFERIVLFAKLPQLISVDQRVWTVLFKVWLDLFKSS